MVLQYTSLNKMLSNFSKVLILHVSFTAVINNGASERASVAFRRHRSNESRF